jgi:hypothetical protein
MTKTKDMARLAQITGLILDLKLADLRAAAAKRQHSLDLLASLNKPSVAIDLSVLATHHAELRYQHWADVRRAEINLVLARQTADMHEARDAAGQAFGKDQALRGVQAKLC